MAELRVGVAGLGAASRLVLPYFGKVEGVRLAAAADIRPEARAAFERDHGLPAYASVEKLCRADIDAVWIETPNHLHAAHAVTAAEHRKHIICAKPLAATLDECERMIAAARAAGVKLLQGHSKIFDSPIQAMADIVRSGGLGRVTHINSWLFNDWLRRPRLKEELDESLGGGLVLRQAPHLIDIATYLANARPVSVRAHMPDTGRCTALIAFEGGASASLSMNGHGRFDSTELTWGIGTFGAKKDGKRLPTAETMTPEEKYGAKGASAYAARNTTAGDAMPFFGLTIVSCEHGDIRQSPQGLYLYTDDKQEELPTPPYIGRAAELIELRDAIRENRNVFPDGAWGKATLEIALAILQSAREGRDIALTHQIQR